MTDDLKPADSQEIQGEAQLALTRMTLFSGLTSEEKSILLTELEEVRFEAGTEVVREGDRSDALFVILQGRVRIQRGDMSVALLNRDDCFGEMGLLSGLPRAGSVLAETPLIAARLNAKSVARLWDEHPKVTLKLYQYVATHLRSLLTDMTDTVAVLLQERSRPQRTSVEARLPDGPRQVKTGTPLLELLPKRMDGEMVVAALMDQKAVALNTPLFASASLKPLLGNHFEGREVYRRSIDLLLLVAGHHLDPTLKLQIGPSLGFAHIIESEDPKGRTLDELASELTHEMRSLVDQRLPFRRERWTVEEARAQFLDQGWDEAARVLRAWRDSTVRLVSFDSLYAFDVIPTVPSTDYLDGFELVASDGDLLLYFGDYERQSSGLVRAVHPSSLAREHEHWLRALGATSLGAFNDICINGEVSKFIRVSEGFHEKRVSQIADEIANTPRPIRVICVTGPSSAGKTTFIKRLSVQLQVNGLTPKPLSLDNYYVDRERTVRDASGEYDYEAFEALDAELLGADLDRLLAGDEVKTARYDFVTGISHPDGGRVMQLGPHDVLMIEGIHSFNPRLPVADEHGVYRVFINPMTSLPLDHLSRIGVSDIRLLRRIVRDRRNRGITASQNIARWPSVRRGERRHIFPHQGRADAVFNSSLIYEPSVLKVYAERYLLEVPDDDPAYTTAHRLRRLIDLFVAIYPDHVPKTSLLREFID